MVDLNKGSLLLDDRLGCFGEFDIEDPICSKYCALCIRCAIERERNVHMEILEDIFTPDSVYMKMQ